jgi:hypothetical protein
VPANRKDFSPTVAPFSGKVMERAGATLSTGTLGAVSAGTTGGAVSAAVVGGPSVVDVVSVITEVTGKVPLVVEVSRRGEKRST